MKKTSEQPSLIGKIFTKSGIIYQVTGTNTLRCIGIKKDKKSVKIADSLKYKGKTYRVTEIGKKAFYKNKKIEQVTLGKNVIEIKDSAFEQCKKLKKVIFGKNLTTIRKRAFYKDKKIVCLDFNGEKLKKVEKKAFSKGEKTKKVWVPSGANEKKYYRLLQSSVVD